VAGPLRNEFGILYADIDAESIDNARRTLDVTGHYSRSDLFSLHVHTGPLKPVQLKAGGKDGAE
jgi:nitrilase